MKVPCFKVEFKIDSQDLMDDLAPIFPKISHFGFVSPLDMGYGMKLLREKFRSQVARKQKTAKKPLKRLAQFQKTNFRKIVIYL